MLVTKDDIEFIESSVAIAARAKIIIPTGTIFYKKVRVVPNKPNKKFGIARLAILTLVSKQPGVLVLSDNCDFKLRVARASVLNAVLMAKNEKCSDWNNVSVSDRVFYDKPQNFTMRSLHDFNFIYKLGEDVVPDTFDNDYDICAGGIHGFLSVNSAVMY